MTELHLHHPPSAETSYGHTLNEATHNFSMKVYANGNEVNVMAPQESEAIQNNHSLKQEDDTSALSKDGVEGYRIISDAPLATGNDNDINESQVEKPNVEFESVHATGARKKRVATRIAHVLRNGFGKKKREIVDNGTNKEVDFLGRVEPLPYSYTGEDKSPNLKVQLFRDKGMLRAMLENLRDDYIFSPETGSGILEHAYRLARNIGDSELSAFDSKGVVMKLLEATRSLSRPKPYEGFYHGKATEFDGPVLGYHREKTKEIGVYSNSLFEEAKNLKEFMLGRGIELKSPADAQVVALMNTVAHESGHNLLAGISEALRGRLGGDLQQRRQLATEYFVGRRVDVALTGNFSTDVASHEERFCEGYAALVTDRVLESLEYNASERAVVFSYFWDKTGITYEKPGDHPIDYADSLDAKNSLVTIGKEIGQKFSLGALGYSMPLSPAEIVEQLQFLDVAVAGKVPLESYIDMRLHPELWKHVVKKEQAGKTPSVIVEQKFLRENGNVIYHPGEGIDNEAVAQASRSLQEKFNEMYERMHYRSSRPEKAPPPSRRKLADLVGVH